MLTYLLNLFRKFVSRRRKQFKLISVCGSNFKAEEKELKCEFENMAPTLKCQMAKSKVHLQFNPPSAPHFGGSCEREIKSIKSALNVESGNQTTTDVVLNTVLIEVEGIMNTKPLGYISSDSGPRPCDTKYAFDGAARLFFTPGHIL